MMTRALGSPVEYSGHGVIVDIMEGFIGLVGRFLGLLISTSIFLALSGVFKLYFSFLLYGVPPKWNLLGATFFLIFAVYGLNKLTDLREDVINNPERVEYVKKLYGGMKYAVMVSLGMALFLGYLTGWKAVAVLIFPIVAGFFYSVRLLPGYPRLKDITGVKNLIIATTWANGTAFLPSIASGGISPLKVILVYYFFFMKSMINTILFDVRDVEGDRLNGINTIPVRFGVGRTRLLLLIMNSSFVLWLLVAYSMGYFIQYLPVLIFAIINGYAYVLYFSRRGYKPGKFLDIWVDGEWFYTLPLAMVL